MKTNPLKEGALTENSAGIGTVTRKMVRERAIELAIINGRSAQEMSMVPVLLKAAAGGSKSAMSAETRDSPCCRLGIIRRRRRTGYLGQAETGNGLAKRYSGAADVR